MLYKAGLKLSESNKVGVKYRFILELKELLLLNFISQSITNKKEKANKQIKRKKEKSKSSLY